MMRGAPLSKTLPLLLLLLLLPEARPTSFVPGAVCDGTNSTQRTSSLLIGRHLIIYEAVWRPFAYIDATQPEGWNGWRTAAPCPPRRPIPTLPPTQ